MRYINKHEFHISSIEESPESFEQGFIGEYKSKVLIFATVLSSKRANTKYRIAYRTYLSAQLPNDDKRYLLFAWLGEPMETGTLLVGSAIIVDMEQEEGYCITRVKNFKYTVMN